MDTMSNQLQMTPGDRETLEADVVSKAKARRLVPTLTIPIRQDNGKVDQFNLFQGDDIKEVGDASGARAQAFLAYSTPSPLPILPFACGVVLDGGAAIEGGLAVGLSTLFAHRGSTGSCNVGYSSWQHIRIGADWPHPLPFPCTCMP